MINQAIDMFPFNANYFNRKDILLNDLFRYDEALEAYDMAFAFSKDDVISSNKAYCML